MPYDIDLDEIRKVALKSRGEGTWSQFALFCDLRGQGLRRPAFAGLAIFLAQAESWSYSERRRFAIWIGEASSRFRDRRVLIPHPLLKALIWPSLLDWAEHEPMNASPHLWMGLLYDHAVSVGGSARHFRQALALDPRCEQARIEIGELILRGVAYSQHALPYAYIDDPQTDLRDLDEAAALMEGVTKVTPQLLKMRRDIGERRTIAADWMKYRAQDRADSRLWRRINRRLDWFHHRQRIT